MSTSLSRRQFLRQSALATAGLAATGTTMVGCKTTTSTDRHGPLYKISLAEWSLHRALRDQKTMTNLDFPLVARQTYGIEAVEFVNQFFKDKARDMDYLKELKNRCESEGVNSPLIMCDGEGRLGDPDAAQRRVAVENHHQWVDAAKYLGCHSIRVNADAGGVGSFEEQQKRAADGLRQLSEYGASAGLNVIVENHGGLSSNGAWLVGVMKMVGLDNCGTLPDFGNFQIKPGEVYDRYRGVAEMMPYAKAVSAKTHDFDLNGNEIHTEYRHMMRIVLSAGYRGYVGVEYEGNELSEPDGIRASKRLLIQVREELSGEFA